MLTPRHAEPPQRGGSRSTRLRQPEPKFDLTIEWGASRSFFGDITERRVDGKIVTSFKPTGTFSVDLTLTRERGGGVLVASEDDLVRLLLGTASLKLVRLDPLDAPPGSAEEAKQKEAASATALPSPHEITHGTSLVSAQGAHAMYSAGWRFVFRPGRCAADAVRGAARLRAQDRPGHRGREVWRGAKLPSSVPVTLSILRGVKGGSPSASAEGALPVLGPSIGLRAGVDVGKGVNVYLGGEYFRNMLDAAQKKDVKDVPSLKPHARRDAAAVSRMRQHCWSSGSSVATPAHLARY